MKYFYSSHKISSEESDRCYTRGKRHYWGDRAGAGDNYTNNMLFWLQSSAPAVLATRFEQRCNIFIFKHISFLFSTFLISIIYIYIYIYVYHNYMILFIILQEWHSSVHFCAFKYDVLYFSNENCNIIIAAFLLRFILYEFIFGLTYFMAQQPLKSFDL